MRILRRSPPPPVPSMQPMDTDSEAIIPPAYSIQQLDGETESGGEETNSGDKESHDKKSDREKPDVDYYIKRTGCSFRNIFFHQERYLH